MCIFHVKLLNQKPYSQSFIASGELGLLISSSLLYTGAASTSALSKWILQKRVNTLSPPPPPIAEFVCYLTIDPIKFELAISFLQN